MHQDPSGAAHGGADEEFNAVVLDEAFVRAAPVHEPNADERIAAAVDARLRRQPPPLPAAQYAPGVGPGCTDARDEWYREGSTDRGHRVVAWLLAVLMGVGVLALAVSAVYRSATGGPATSPKDSSGVGRTLEPGDRQMTSTQLPTGQTVRTP